MDDIANETTRYQYEYLAHQIEREDGLINTRITWMLTFEGFLFTALALVSKQDKIDTPIYFVLTIALPLIGIIVGAQALLAVKAALSALEVLKKLWDPQKFKNFPPPFGGDGQHKRGAIYAEGLPLVMMLTWSGIFLALLVIKKYWC